jgi:Na+/phosphate symporter
MQKFSTAKNPFASKKGKFEKLLYHMVEHLRDNSYDTNDPRYRSINDCARAVRAYLNKIDSYVEEERKEQMTANEAKRRLDLSNEDWETLPDVIQSKLINYMMKQLANEGQK